MAKAKHTNVKGSHKDSADKNSMNRGGQKASTPGTQEQDPKRRIGQHSGEGEPPLMKK
jgi:hypothetical protein